MLPNKSANSGAIKGAEVGEASFPPPLVSLMKKNMKQAPSLGIMNYKPCAWPRSLAGPVGRKRGPGRPAAARYLPAQPDAALAFPSVALDLWSAPGSF